jgi:hypothetical protein
MGRTKRQNTEDQNRDIEGNASLGMTILTY